MTGDTTQANQPGPDAGKPAFASLGAVLGVRDIEPSSKFYQSLGFRQEAAFPRSDGQVTLVILRYGSSTLLLGRLDELHYENETRAKMIRQGPHELGVTLTLLVPDLMKVYHAVKEANLEILLEPVNEFYGDLVFMFLDPDGYEWKVSQWVKQVSPEEVAEIIQAS